MPNWTKKAQSTIRTNNIYFKKDMTNKKYKKLVATFISTLLQKYYKHLFIIIMTKNIFNDINEIKL